MSLGPPGVKPTTKWIGRSGNALGCASEGLVASASAAAKRPSQQNSINNGRHDTQGASRRACRVESPATFMSANHDPQVSPVMRELAAYIASAPRKPLPAAVTEKTKHHVLDTIAA